MTLARTFLGMIGLAGSIVTSAALAAPAQERFNIYFNDEQVGYVHAQREPGKVGLDFRIDDNGRGPATHETIELGADGAPRTWRIDGHSELGARVEETFELRTGRAHWKTRNDEGSAVDAAPHLYLANDASPYALFVYFQALQAAPNLALPAWPSGAVRAERVRDLQLDLPGGAQSVRVWALRGLDFAPNFVLTDASNQVRALLDTYVLTVWEPWSSAASKLKALAQEMNRDALHEISSKVLHTWDAPVLIRNVRVFDPVTGGLSPIVTVSTYRGAITGVGSEIPVPKDAIVFDGEGGTVLPGLFDVHAHLGPWDGPLDLAAGVTTVRDMGNDNALLDVLVSNFDSGTIAGPHVLRSGFLEGRSPYSARVGIVADTLEEALAAVRWYAVRGYWQLKIYNSAHPDWVPALAREAHRLGMRVAGHVPAFSSSERAVREGYDEVTHINQLLLGFLIDTDKEDTRTPFRFTALGERAGRLDLHGADFTRMIHLMQEHGTAHDPTLGIFYGMLLARPGELAPTVVPWADHMPSRVLRGLKATQLDVAPEQEAAYRASAQRLLDAVKLLHDSGIRIFPGTDDIAGIALHTELETWQRAGIAPAEILRIATLGCAQYFHLDQQRGTIERGKSAELLLVPGDPTKDVGLLRQARLVMKGGAVVFPEEVHSALQIRPFSTRPPVTMPSLQN